MKGMRLVLIIFLAFLAIKGQAQNKNLFNGKNLDGWQVHGTEKWYVEKGDLI